MQSYFKLVKIIRVHIDDICADIGNPIVLILNLQNWNASSVRIGTKL